MAQVIADSSQLTDKILKLLANSEGTKRPGYEWRFHPDDFSDILSALKVIGLIGE